MSCVVLFVLAAPTLGDAVFVAMARLELGISGLLVIECMGGDFDEDGSFSEPSLPPPLPSLPSITLPLSGIQR